MKRFGLDEIRTALTELDAKLTTATAITLIGGAAVALTLDDPELLTKDVDAFGVSRPLLSLARTLSIPIDTAAIADLPWNFEDRRVLVLRLPLLEVMAPEPHDLVLSKISRWSEGDEDHATRLHRRRALDFDTLVTRYQNEMSHAVGDPLRLRLHFLMCVASLFGSAARARAAARIPEPSLRRR